MRLHVLGVVLLAFACSGPRKMDRSEQGDAALSADVASSEPTLFPSQIPADFQCEATLESIRSGIFVTSCSWDTCHGNRNDAAWGLRLATDAQSIYDGLVNVRAGSCLDWMLVVPGDPANSFLWNKVSEAEPACGERMPRGVEPLPQVALDCIRGWIEQL